MSISDTFWLHSNHTTWKNQYGHADKRHSFIVDTAPAPWASNAPGGLSTLSLQLQEDLPLTKDSCRLSYRSVCLLSASKWNVVTEYA